MNYHIIYSILDNLRIRHTKIFVRKMCIGNIQGNNLLGMIRLLEVFGVKSRAVRIEDGNDFKDLNLPYICSFKNEGGFILVTDQNDNGLSYTYGRTKEQSDWATFQNKVENLAVMLSAKQDASEPQYKKRREIEVYQNCLWSIPIIWLLWLLALQFSVVTNTDASIPSSTFRFSALGLSSIGLFLSILLHRQWTGDGNAVERVCSHFKTSKCSAAHDTFFFNKYFDLSEVGISYFLAIMFIVLITPQMSWSIAWIILPALPASLWNIGYQFFKQKSWCPLCLGVQILFWIIALVLLLCGAYSSLSTFNVFDIIYSLLLWGTILVVMLKTVTPAIENRHKAENALYALSSLKGNKSVTGVFLGEVEKGVRDIIIAVSPTCPYCKNALETIEDILIPTGRFTLEKKYMPIHDGDDKIIANLIGIEEAEKHAAWCKEHNVSATPTIFFNGKLLDKTYSVEDLIYI